ncbi:MAG TPA: hypothetical protein PKO15_18285, partial [Fibrobacteria bacterium]|nr:hypothetical protein [Fibrobacteria bacterium]
MVYRILIVLPVDVVLVLLAPLEHISVGDAVLTFDGIGHPSESEIIPTVRPGIGPVVGRSLLDLLDVENSRLEPFAGIDPHQREASPFLFPNIRTRRQVRIRPTGKLNAVIIRNVHRFRALRIRAQAIGNVQFRRQGIAGNEKQHRCGQEGGG